MSLNSKHKATISKVFWKDVRDKVAEVNPQFAAIVDKLSPDSKYPIFTAKYPFGARIAHEGKLYLPTSTGKTAPIDSPKIDNAIQQRLQRRDLPISMMLKNSAEIFYEMPDRVVSRFLMEPGNFWGLWEHYDPENSGYFKWSWSMTSGARTLYLTPKIANVMGHKAVRKKYETNYHIPKNHSEHWNIFVDIANSSQFKTEWFSEILFFPDNWFEKASKDPAWHEFYSYLLNVSWKESHFWRDKSTFDLIWETFVYDVMDKNIRPNLYLAYVVKQLILIGVGVLPALTVATDDKAAPIKELQQIFIEHYQLREYMPIFMQPHTFSSKDKHPVYFSLQYPNLLETVPVIQTLPSVLSSMPEIMSLIQTFREKTHGRSQIAKNSPVNHFFENVILDYFHYRQEKRNNIHSTNELIHGDTRFSNFLKDEKNNVFPSTSNLMSGCVRFMNKKRLK